MEARSQKGNEVKKKTKVGHTWGNLNKNLLYKMSQML